MIKFKNYFKYRYKIFNKQKYIFQNILNSKKKGKLLKINKLLNTFNISKVVLSLSPIFNLNFKIISNYNTYLISPSYGFLFITILKFKLNINFKIHLITSLYSFSSQNDLKTHIVTTYRFGDNFYKEFFKPYSLYLTNHPQFKLNMKEQNLLHKLKNFNYNSKNNSFLNFKITENDNEINPIPRIRFKPGYSKI